MGGSSNAKEDSQFLCASAWGKINKEEGESHYARSAHYEVTFINRLLTWSQGDSETSRGEVVHKVDYYQLYPEDYACIQCFSSVVSQD